MHDIYTKQPSSCSQHKKCTGKIKTKFCVRNDNAIAKLTHKSFWSHTIFLYSIFHAWSFFYCPVCMSTLRTSQNHNHMRLSMKMYCTDHHCNAVWVSYTALVQYKTILGSCLGVLYCTTALQNNTEGSCLGVQTPISHSLWSSQFSTRLPTATQIYTKYWQHSKIFCMNGIF